MQVTYICKVEVTKYGQVNYLRYKLYLCKSRALKVVFNLEKVYYNLYIPSLLNFILSEPNGLKHFLMEAPNYLNPNLEGSVAFLLLSR